MTRLPQPRKPHHAAGPSAAPCDCHSGASDPRTRCGSTPRRWQVVLACCLLIVLSKEAALADEGMWLFNDLPVAQLAEKYDFEPTDEWARHIMLSSVRFNSGGSASFVSSRGLVLTNHHVAADTLHKLSTPEHNYVENGFLAASPADEVAAPDLELNQLVSIEDVTARVNAAVTAEMSAADAFRARQAVMAEIEKESLDETGLRSDVITLFGGAKYHLYRYRKYTDVRLVWAPETKAAFFGGDADNFEYPRYCLDAALFRVYEDGQPARIDHFLRYSENGPAEGELVFVSGNPGRTQRIFTVAALKYLRDRQLPYLLDYLRRREILMQQFGFEGKEQQRRARDELFGIQNSRKAYTGMVQGLQDPDFLISKETAEQALLERLSNDDELRKYAAAWETIADVQQRRAELLGQTSSFHSELYSIAETLVLMAAEDQKPSGQRLREFRDSARESLELQLYSPAPIYEDLEFVKLADSLSRFVELRGGDDPLVAQVLMGHSPRERAAELIQGTALADVAARRQLAADGLPAIADIADPMIGLARTMEDEYRRLYQINEELEELERQAYAQITEATVRVSGTSGYPDATFTLRLAFGTVKGYVDDGQPVPPWTTMEGAFEHEAAHGAEGDWVLPDSWHVHQAATGGSSELPLQRPSAPPSGSSYKPPLGDKLNLQTPLNFVCTADIIGGNSGSPVINREGEFVGIIFDGNVQSLTADYFYSDEVARAVAVHSSAIREALKSIYGAPQLASELGQ